MSYISGKYSRLGWVPQCRTFGDCWSEGLLEARRPSWCWSTVSKH